MVAMGTKKFQTPVCNMAKKCVLVEDAVPQVHTVKLKS